GLGLIFGGTNAQLGEPPLVSVDRNGVVAPLVGSTPISTCISVPPRGRDENTTGALLMQKVLSPLSSHTVAAALASRLIVTKPTRERQALREPAHQSRSRYERARNACPSLSIR